MIFSKTKEYAKVIDWSPLWDSGAPMPQVFSNGQKTYLIYLIDEIESKIDNSTIQMIDNASDILYSLALIEFDGHTFRFGIANDEVFSGLPLYNKGLKPYCAHVIENSSWISDLKEIHKVHPYYDNDKWIDLKHYVLLFHDEIFEIVAKDFIVKIYKSTFKDLAIEIAINMNKK